MRVSCLSIEEFIENLTAEQDVFLKTVYFSETEKPLGNESLKGAVVTETIVHASAVVIVDSASQYLLEGAENCGRNYKDAEEELIGKEFASQLRESLQSFCDSRGWKIRPGILDA